MNPRKITVDHKYTYRPLREHDRVFGKGLVPVWVDEKVPDYFGRGKWGYQITCVETGARGIVRANELKECVS